MRVISRLAVVLAFLAIGAPVAWAQSAGSNAAVPPVAPVPAAVTAQSGVPNQARSGLRKGLPLPVDIPRIEREVVREPAIKLDDERLRFYALVVGKQPPKWEGIVGDYDLMNGPTHARGGAAMTHREFLDMVTPQELNELFGATTRSSLAMAQAAIMNAAGQAILKKAVQAIRSAHSDSEVSAIRQQIDRELSALQGKTP